MAFFKFDETQATEGFELVAEGKYEAIVQNAEAGKTQAGKDKLTVDFEIRADYQQPHQGAKILYNTFTFEHEVAQRIVNSLIKACGFPNGVEFASSDDLAKQLVNKSLLITVKHEADRQDPNKVYAKAKYYAPSKIAPAVAQNTGVKVGSEDLPF